MMPPKKRTSQSKPTSPTTTTSHASVDQHHQHLHRTSQSIGTRIGAGTSPTKASPALLEKKPTQENPSTQKARGAHEEKQSAGVSPPSPRTRLFSRFVYALCFSALLLLGWYVYEMSALLKNLRDEVGWWGVIVGDTGGPPAVRWEGLKGWEVMWPSVSRVGRAGQEAQQGGGLEGSLNALADTLGVSPVQVASAVRPLIPQASLAAIASKTGDIDSEVVRVLLEDTTRGQTPDEARNARFKGEFAERLGKTYHDGAEDEVGDAV